MQTILRNGQTILFAGASIVDAGRRDWTPPLGDGFVSLFAGLMAIREPEKRVKVINKGIGGNRTTDLKERWQDDVIRFKPDHLVIQVGMNDIHSRFTNNYPWDPGAIEADTYQKNYDEILAHTVKCLPKCQIMLIDPFYMSVETDPNSHAHRVLSALPGYVAAVGKLSRKFRTRRVETHKMFQEILRHKHRHADEFTPENIHPNVIGHLAMAEAVYTAFCK